MTHGSSCLVTKLSHYIDIAAPDRKRLAELEKSERSYGGGVDVRRQGDPNADLFVVKEGWLFSYSDLPDGRRQIVTLHHPGDIIGFPDIALRRSATTLATAEPAVLCPFPKAALDRIFRESPRLSALLLSIALRDQVVFIDLLRAMGQMTAFERISYMLLDLAARLRITDAQMTDRFRLPLTQTHIADYLGLTNVYVSKTILAMERDGYLRREGGCLHLLQEAHMAEMTDFQERYQQMDTSWFPKGA
ncbi:MAG TPA: Crp/Fnr family transcriptional regulator [Roseovarius sp.]